MGCEGAEANKGSLQEVLTRACACSRLCLDLQESEKAEEEAEEKKEAKDEL